MLVSIIIPAHNAVKWILESMVSALAQTHRDVEVIVVDDGSTDGTAAALDGISDLRLQVVRQTNAGAAAARNHGLRLAKGDFIQFLDADDLLDAEKLERQLACATRSDGGTVFSGPWQPFRNAPGNLPLNPELVWRDCVPVDWLVDSLAGAE